MRVLVTGARGTVGRPLCAALRARGDAVVPWDRSVVSPHDSEASAAFVREVAPDLVMHLAIASFPTGLHDEGWRVNVGWTELLGNLAREAGYRLLFTSTAMVFTNDAKGPFRLDSPPDAAHGYGGEKRRCEERLGELCPHAVIARLGWQIGAEPGSNNMLDFLERNTREAGRVRASRRWFPACSFLDDTLSALLWLGEQSGGLYQLDSNRGWSLFQIAEALNEMHGGRWPVEPTDDFVYDQRLIDPRVPMPALSERLATLGPMSPDAQSWS